MNYNSELQSNNAELQAVLNEVNNLPNAESGENGATFLPAVSEDGVISWSNDKGLENPPPVNIKGPKGDNYLLTAEDKKEIAEQVPIVKVPSEPLFAPNVESMTDTSKAYVNTETMTFWRYQKNTHEKVTHITDELDDTTYYDGSRLGSSSTSLTDGITNDAPGYHVTPLIDLTKAEYQGKIVTIHLEGVHYLSESTIETYIMHRYYKTDGSVHQIRGYSYPDQFDSMALWKNATFAIESDTSATITINMPLLHGSDKTECGYLRFCGKGAVANSRIYITYQEVETVTEEMWVDSGICYTPNVTESDKQDIANDVANMIDSELISIIGDGEVIV